MASRGLYSSEPIATPRESGPPPEPYAAADERRRSLAEGSFHGALVLLCVAAALALVPLWAPLLLASWVALAIRPLHSKLARKIGGRSSAAGVVTVLLVLLCLLPLVVLGLSLFSSAVSLAAKLRESGGLQEAMSTLLQSKPTLSGGQFALPKVMDFVQKHGGGALNAASMFFGAAATATVGLFVFVYGFYTFLVDGRRLRAWLLDHSPLERWQTERWFAAYEETGRGLLIGVGLTALLQGGIAMLGYVIIGVPQALVLGLVTVFAALIPSIGTGLVWAPLAVGLLIAGHAGSAAAVLGLGAVVSVLDNFVRPLLSRVANVDLPTFLLLVAMLGGIVTFGAWGLLAGPLFVRLAVEGLRLGRERRELGPDPEPQMALPFSTVPGE
jgi:predicted PurR-regulated permease PerM